MFKVVNTLFIGKVFKTFDCLDSTNAFALDLLAKSSPIEGTVISTYEQRAGKGQFGSSWESQAGKNITLSVILYPHFLAIKDQFLLSQIVCLSLVELLQDFIEKPVEIKWPNDIYVGTSKMAGILIENQLRSHKIKHSVVGIGLNVNQVSFAPNLVNPTSLSLETGKTYLLEELIQGFCKLLEVYYLQLKAGQYSKIKTAYQEKLWGFQETRRYQEADGREFEGQICGLESNGELIIEEKGIKKSYQFKQIRPVLGF